MKKSYLYLLFIFLIFTETRSYEFENLSKPLLRELYFNLPRAFPDTLVNSSNLINAIEEVSSLHNKKLKSENYILAQEPEWRNIGPERIGGRIKSIAHHPSKSGHFYIGAAAGGIWETTNYGSSWSPLFQFENSIAFGSIAIDPFEPNIMYAGTGEAVVGAGNIYFGSGIYKSYDAGKSWSLLGLSDVGAFSKVYIHPKNTDLLYAGAVAQNPGFYRSLDAGKSWVNLFEKQVTDVSINPIKTNELFIGVLGEGIYYSKDAGESWELRNTGLGDEFIGRVSVQYAPSQTNILYALMERKHNRIGIIYKSTNEGKSWIKVYEGNNEFFRLQGFYNNFIKVHPKNPNIVLAGGIDLWRTQNGGSTWHNVRNNVAGAYSMHVDQHCAVFDPSDPNKVYVGNDGGIYYSRNAGTGWVNINNNLQITQFYALAIDNSAISRNFGGTQDNGTLGNPLTQKWKILAGGDGMDVIVDKKYPNVIYGEYQYGGLWKVVLSNSGEIVHFENLTNGIPSDDKAIWHAPFTEHPAIPGYFFHGRHALYSSTNNGAYWYEIKNRENNRFTAIGLSILNKNVIYAGNEVGDIFISLNSGSNWKKVNSNILPKRYITSLTASEFDSASVYVTYSGYGVSHIYKSTDYGNTWLNISKELPDVPVSGLAEHPNNPKMLFIATDVGVFATFNGGGTWFPYGRNLPRSPVVDIAFHKNRILVPDLTLRVATHGRSVWEINVPDIPFIEPYIVNPAGGEVWLGNNYYNITWYGIESPVKVEYYSNGQWIIITEHINGNSFLWLTPDINELTSYIRVSSINEPSIYAISKSFTLKLRTAGDILNSYDYDFVPYGIVCAHNDGLWVSDFNSNQLYKLDKHTLKKEKSINIPFNDLVTDITFSNEQNYFYIHRMNNSDGAGGVIAVLDTLGNMLTKFDSPANNYPIGLTYSDGFLYATERDSPRKIYKISIPDYETIDSFDNPYQISFGPRSITNDENYFYQVCTGFPSGILSESKILKLKKSNLDVVDEINLSTRTGLLNARGIEYDNETGDFWISDFSGTIYKIAGFEKITVSVEYFKNENHYIYPNPASDFVYLSSMETEKDYDELIIIDYTGQIVFAPEIKNKQYNIPHRLDISGLPIGVYIVIYKKAGIFVKQEKLSVIR